jgi:hypothetical protein
LKIVVINSSNLSATTATAVPQPSGASTGTDARRPLQKKAVRLEHRGDEIRSIWIAHGTEPLQDGGIIAR